MYLNVKRYFSGDEKRAVELRKMFSVPDSGNLEYAEVKFEIGYWRKANHIHNWFIKNVQNGKDDCSVYEVSREIF